MMHLKLGELYRQKTMLCYYDGPAIDYFAPGRTRALQSSCMPAGSSYTTTDVRTGEILLFSRIHEDFYEGFDCTYIEFIHKNKVVSDWFHTEQMNVEYFERFYECISC